MTFCFPPLTERRESYLSGLVCSCQNPTTCPSSCTTMPNLSQFFPIEIAWGCYIVSQECWSSCLHRYWILFYLGSISPLPHKTTAATRSLCEDCKHNYCIENPTKISLSSISGTANLSLKELLSKSLPFVIFYL